MTTSLNNIQVHDDLQTGLRTIAAFDGKSEHDVLHDIIIAGIRSRMETISSEWFKEKDAPPEDCLCG